MKTRTLIALPLVAIVALAGCTEPGYMNDPNSKTQKGAITGALIGGIVGLAQGDGAGKAAAGAVIGGAVGAGIGNALDKQAADLRQDLGNDNVTIVNTGSQLIVTLPQDILFATDSAVVRAGLQSDLGALARNLQDYPSTTVQVVGHTDNTGSASYNQDLSTRRASSVSAILIANGTASYRIQSYGRGEDAPVATNLTAEGRAQNRRVEIVISPNT
ncbi:OmpA family protein [Pacificibacter marinus]|uniref:Putative lipoprotein YiaD n=1 Tax=Pacificibacter marinus TaxID=658057 RepID=A0A1Y5S8Q8_9RHOB|nr:OmpA family protein [Pacificibacter marinus]SEK76013.1 Outer membrane protein OmpA [Pacificibacter marinus]SLN34698.1 putative lipoprotein YiaD precursor [Pacificibacter marinus]